MVRKVFGILCYTLGILCTIASLQSTAAINSTKLERDAIAVIAKDQNAFVQLEGLEATKRYDLNGSYRKVGSITNNSNQELYMVVVLSPDDNYRRSNYRLKLKLGGEDAEIKKTTKDTLLYLTLSPGQSLPIQASLTNKNNTNNINLSFQFLITDSSLSYSVTLGDTQRSPRRMICY